DRRADRAGDRDRGRDEQELVDLVGGAVVRQFLQLEDLAHGHAHDRDRDPVPGLVDAGLALVRPHLAAPGVAGERRQFGLLDEVECLEREAGGIAARIAVPTAGLLAALHHAGAHDDIVAAFERDVLLLRAREQIVIGDAVAVLKRLDAFVAGDVEQHAAADHLVLGLLDAALLRAGGCHLAAVVAVPHGILVEHVAEPVPLRAALQRHGHHIVGGADAALVEHARIGVGAGAQHGVDRVGAAHARVFALGALRPGMVVIERERDHLAFFDQAGGGDDVFGAGVIEGADLVVGAPFAPVFVLFRGLAHVLAGDFLGRHRMSFSYSACGFAPEYSL